MVATQKRSIYNERRSFFKLISISKINVNIKKQFQLQFQLQYKLQKTISIKNNFSRLISKINIKKQNK
jgi:hypothetical protein